MKSFTKFFALMMAMLVTLGMTAQISELEYQVMQQKAQQEINDHGPTVEVPNAAEGSTRAVGDDCTDPIMIDFGTDLTFQYQQKPHVEGEIPILHPVWVLMMAEKIFTSSLLFLLQCGSK